MFPLKKIYLHTFLAKISVQNRGVKKSNQQASFASQEQAAYNFEVAMVEAAKPEPRYRPKQTFRDISKVAWAQLCFAQLEAPGVLENLADKPNCEYLISLSCVIFGRDTVADILKVYFTTSVTSFKNRRIFFGQIIVEIPSINQIQLPFVQTNNILTNNLVWCKQII